jgi:hypothetical protein
MRRARREARRLSRAAGRRLASLVVELCLVGARLVTAIARLRARQSPGAKTLFIAVPVIFYGCVLTTCTAAFVGQ